MTMISRRAAGSFSSPGSRGLPAGCLSTALPPVTASRQRRTSEKVPTVCNTCCNSAAVRCQTTIDGASSTTSATSNQRSRAGRNTGVNGPPSAIRSTVASSSMTKLRRDAKRRPNSRIARLISRTPGSAVAVGARMRLARPSPAGMPPATSG